MVEDQSNGFRKKLEYFKNSGETCHVVLKSSRWWNGKIVEIGDGYFTLDEVKKGKMPIFFVDIARLDPFNKQDKEETKA